MPYIMERWVVSSSGQHTLSGDLDSITDSHGLAV
jgi:hypothetical protein